MPWRKCTPGSVPIDEDSELVSVKRLLPGLPSPSGFLVFLALLVALGPGLPRMFSSDGDVGRHIRVGTGILSKREIPTADSLSHTRYGGQWIPKEWLSQVALAEADRLNGLSGVATLAAFLFAVSVLATYVNATLLGGSIGVAVGLAATSMLLQAVHLLARPHLVTTALASILLLLLVQYRRTARSRWILFIPALFVVWANSHGGFPAGLALLTLFCFDTWLGGRGPNIRRQQWTLIVVLALAIVATMVNPAGPAIWSHLAAHLGNEFFMGITEEFQSPDFHAPWGRLLLAVILGTALILGTSARRLPWLGLATLLGTLAATLVSARHITLFATLGLPWLASLRADASSGGTASRPERPDWPLHTLVPRSPEISSATSHVLPLIACGLLVLAVNGPFAARGRFDSTTFPVQALRELSASEKTGAVFNEMEWGGYLLYAQPGIPVFIDGHADFFGEDLVREYLTARLGGSGWEEVLHRYQVEWTITRSEAPLNQLLELSEGWQFVLNDGLAAVYRRDDGDRTGSERRMP